MDHVKRIWYLSQMRAAKVQASLRIRAVSPEPPLLAHTSNESRGTFRQKARSLAPLNGWTCAVKICHEGMLEDTNSLDGVHIYSYSLMTIQIKWKRGDDYIVRHIKIKYMLNPFQSYFSAYCKLTWYNCVNECSLLLNRMTPTALYVDIHMYPFKKGLDQYTGHFMDPNTDSTIVEIRASLTLN